MRIKNMHPAYQIIVILIGIFLFSTLVSADVRAMVKSLFTFNGVEIMLDDTTHELTAVGNEEAIIYQNGQEVVIQGVDKAGVEADWLLQVVVSADSGKISKAVGNLDAAGDFIPQEDKGQDKKEREKAKGKKDQDLKKISVRELETLWPDFKVPTEAPTGYTLNPWGYILSDKSVVLSWDFPDKGEIKYIWGNHARKVQHKLGTADRSEAFTVVTVESKKEAMTLLIFQGETENIPFIMIATDSTLSAEQLRVMVP